MKNYAGMSTKELQQLADDQKNRQAALAQLAQSDPSAMNAMTSSERSAFIHNQELQRRNDWHKEIAGAQSNFRDRQYHTAISDPGRNSPITNAKIIAEHNANVNRAEEAAARELEAKTRLGEANAKRAGMIGQGRDAARAQWGQMIDGKFIPGGQAAIAELNNQGALDRAKLENGWTDDDGNRHQGSKEIISAGLSAAQKELGEMQFGKIAPDGTITPGANERVETIRGNSAVRQQEEANKGLLAQAEMQRQAKVDALAAQIEKATIAAGGKVDAAKIAANAKIISSEIDAGAALGKDSAAVIRELQEKHKDDPEMSVALKAVGGEEQQKPNGPKEGDRKKFSDGEAVFKNGRWEKV